MKFEVRFDNTCNCGFPTTRIIEAHCEKDAMRKAKIILKKAGHSWYIASFKQAKGNQK